MEERYEIDVQLDKKTLDRFLIRNNFLRAGGVAGLLISFAAILGLIVFWKEFAVSQRVILVFLGAMFTVIHAIWHFAERMEPIKKRCIPQTISLYFFRRWD